MNNKTVDTKGLDAIALSIRTLTMDAVQKAKSGHPGLPMGCAELGALIFGEILNHYPALPGWDNRDRFVLSAGHGSMLLYSLLHLSGYAVSLEDIKAFRQLGSLTPGHPEYRHTPGVETTTGPLGQGFTNAVGMAIAERLLAARFNTSEFNLIDYHIYALASDGDLMEGVSQEAASLAGHLGLGKLIVFYDSNRITIEGSTDLAFSDDVIMRFKSYHWNTAEADAYDYQGIMKLVEEAKQVTDRPSLIKINSIIARGAKNMSGSHKAHGAPLGEEEIKATKAAFNLDPNAMFYIDPAVEKYISAKKQVWEENYLAWKKMFDAWSAKHPELAGKWKEYFNRDYSDYKVGMDDFKTGEKMATRAASGKVLNAIAREIENLAGGSADLAPSNNTNLTGIADFQKDSPEGRNFHFGIREHAMGGILNGMALSGGIRPFGATFLVFADYMRPSIRLASLMKLPVIYIFTHDSFFVGEDGPTHQPVEQIASLRLIPGLTVLRPADAQETRAAWEMAVANAGGPTALILTRQNLEVFAKADQQWESSIRSGAYTVKDSVQEPEIVIVATGSEVNLAVQTCREIDSKNIRIISMICPGLFLAQPEASRRKLIPAGAKVLVIEAGVSFGWHGFAGNQTSILGLDHFGECGPYAPLAEKLGFSVKRVAAEIQKLEA